MRHKLLQEVSELGSIPASTMCGECCGDASRQLYDALMQATGQTHVTLHMIARRSPSMTAFQRAIDGFLMRQGKKSIDWRKLITVARTITVPAEPADASAATIPAPPPETN